MKHTQTFDQAIALIDTANAEDPRMESADGKDCPCELLFSQRVYRWVEKLTNTPSEALLLAARAHTMRRWMIPRDTYPMTTPGYHDWRRALANFHAEQADKTLRTANYSSDGIELVIAFILRTNWPDNKEACILEDADCLVFFETKLHKYADDWDSQKSLRVLMGTLRKMTEEGRSHIQELSLSDEEQKMIREATQLAGL